MNTALEKVSGNPHFAEQMAKILLGVRYMNQQDFTRFFVQEDAVFKALIQRLGLYLAPGTR